jgi:hypothetical protein
MRAGGPRIATGDMTLFGVYYGVVVNTQDPLNQDRVRVKLPWLDHSDDDQAYWAQLATPMAGNQYGWYTLPEIDDVVAVMFVAGHIAHPVILGGVWSTPDISPEPNEDGKNNFRGFRSRSGHRMVLDDSGSTKVYFADKSGKNVLGLGKFATEGAGPNICAVYKPPMSGDGGVSISTMEGKFEISCPKGTLKVTGENIKINAKTTMDIKAGGAFSMEGSSAAKVTSSAPSNYDAPSIDIG